MSNFHVILYHLLCIGGDGTTIGLQCLFRAITITQLLVNMNNVWVEQ
jgi:hypothetical protein